MEKELSVAIKESTTAQHQQLEKIVVTHLKQIQSNSDYVQVLRNFCVFFKAVEAACEPYLLQDGRIDARARRDSAFIARDIAELGGNLDNLPAVQVPQIENFAQAMGALYVLEGSVLGGPYIVQMLAKLGLVNGVSFFTGYGADTQVKWSSFLAVLNSITEPTAQAQVVDAAKATFANFKNVF
jgi:heme oxygenase